MSITVKPCCQQLLSPLLLLTCCHYPATILLLSCCPWVVMKAETRLNEFGPALTVQNSVLIWSRQLCYWLLALFVRREGDNFSLYCSTHCCLYHNTQWFGKMLCFLTFLNRIYTKSLLNSQYKSQIIVTQINQITSTKLNQIKSTFCFFSNINMSIILNMDTSPRAVCYRNMICNSWGNAQAFLFLIIHVCLFLLDYFLQWIGKMNI